MRETQGFSENAIRILKARYFMKNEKGELQDKTPADLFHRVAHHLASAERAAADRKAWARTFFETMMSRDFLPNSPTLTGAGRDMCLSACFVLPIEDSMESIFDAVKNTAIIHKSGEIRWIEQRNVILHDEGGRSVGVEGFCTDITLQVEMEEALRQSQERFTLAMQAASDEIARVLGERASMPYKREAIKGVLWEALDRGLGPCPRQ